MLLLRLLDVGEIGFVFYWWRSNSRAALYVGSCFEFIHCWFVLFTFIWFWYLSTPQYNGFLTFFTFDASLLVHKLYRSIFSWDFLLLLIYKTFLIIWLGNWSFFSVLVFFSIFFNYICAVYFNRFFEYFLWCHSPYFCFFHTTCRTTRIIWFIAITFFIITCNFIWYF